MIDYGKYRCIKVERENKLATVTLNRPEALNAVNSELHDELEHIWIDLAIDEEVNAILLTGAGKAFSAGGDVKAMAARWGTEEGRKWTLKIASAGRRIIQNLLDVEQPIIAAGEDETVNVSGRDAVVEHPR